MLRLTKASFGLIHSKRIHIVQRKKHRKQKTTVDISFCVHLFKDLRKTNKFHIDKTSSIVSDMTSTIPLNIKIQYVIFRILCSVPPNKLFVNIHTIQTKRNIISDKDSRLKALLSLFFTFVFTRKYQDRRIRLNIGN
ncbi:hypothetical protein GW750_09460 [bacterium]|nr:hypothetical protein [bacterium]